MTWIQALIAVCCIPWLALFARWLMIQLRRRRDLFTSFYRRELAEQMKRQRTSRP